MYIRKLFPLLMLTLVACGPKYIPNTEVPDNPKNREIVELVERYRQAVEERNINALKEMISRSYFPTLGLPRMMKTIMLQSWLSRRFCRF